jgi:TolB-like protein/Flp pilus assembly protein TadD
MSSSLGRKVLKNIARPIGVYALKSEVVAAALSAFSPNASGPPRFSFVVLPFANLSNDPDQAYFVDGVTESLTTDLSRIIGSFVIGRSTAFTYKGKNVDLKQIGRELNVRYILEGSIQRSGNRMRVNVQLIDAESGNHMWADRFEKPLADLFDMHDEIVARLANALTARLIVAEARRTERAPDPDSMDLSHQGWAWLFKDPTPNNPNLATARHLFERALALDSANAPALVGVAFVDIKVALGLPNDQTARFAAAEEAFTRALSLVPEGAAAHLGLGIVQLYTNRAPQGIRECEWALELDPNLAEAHAVIGFVKILLGRAEDTEAHIRQALRLSPRDASVSDWYRAAGLAKLYLSEEEEAIAWLRSSVETTPNIPLTHFLMAAALVRLGRLPEARSEAQAGLTIDPTFTISRFRANALSDNPAYLAQRERAIEDFRKAGLPEE